MKTTLTFKQWEHIGNKMGWDITAQLNDDIIPRRRTIKVHYDDGDTTVTDINGTKQEIENYYLNSESVDYDISRPDATHRPVKVEFLK